MSITVSIGGNVHGVIPYLGSSIGMVLHMSVIMYRYSQVIEYKVSYIFKEDKVGDKKS